MKKYIALTLGPIMALIGAFLQSPVTAQQSTAPAPPTPYTQTFVRDPKIPVDEEYTVRPESTYSLGKAVERRWLGTSRAGTPPPS